MFDENGNEIDLDIVDAIGQLPDGRFEVWLENERRLITSHPNAVEVWHQYIRSKVSHAFPRTEEAESATS